MSEHESVEGLSVSREGAVVDLVLDRPQKRNAMTDEMVQGMISAITGAANDGSARAIVIRGTGDHFCGGFDIVARNEGIDTGEGTGARPRTGSIQRRLPTQAHRLISLMVSVQVPIVCVARGWAAGIGLQLLLAADFALVSEDAHLWEPFSQRGFSPDSGATWLLPRRIGEVRAREMLLLGRELSGKEAYEWGMVHKAVIDAALESEAARLVATLSSGPSVALGLTKWLLSAGASQPLDEHLQHEAFAMEVSSRSPDFKEGLAAFREKRAPRFTGR